MSIFQKKLLIHSGIFLAIVIAFGFSLYFLGERISAETAKIEDVRKQLYDWVVSLESFAAIRSEYSAKAGRYMQVIENRLPEKELLFDLKKDIQFVAGSEGLISSIVFNQDMDIGSGQLGAVSFTLNVSGDYDAVARFAKRLNEIKYLVSIEGITLIGQSDNAVDIEMKGKVLYRK